MSRLRELEIQKRNIEQVSTPSPSHRKKQPIPSASGHTDHSYGATPLSGTSKRQVLLVDESEELDNSPLDPALRTIIENRILCETEQAFATLCARGDGGSVLGRKKAPVKQVPMLAVQECRTRTPFLFRMLQVLSRGSEDTGFVFVIYSILLRQQSQELNFLQRILTAACVRHHAGHQVIFLVFLSFDSNKTSVFADAQPGIQYLISIIGLHGLIFISFC